MYLLLSFQIIEKVSNDVINEQEKTTINKPNEQEKEVKTESSKQEVDKRTLIEKLKKMQALLAKAKEALDIKSRALGEAMSENEKLKKALGEAKEGADGKAKIAELQQLITAHRKDADILQIKNAALEKELVTLRKKTADSAQELSSTKQNYDQVTSDLEKFKRALAEKDKTIQEQLLAQESAAAAHHTELESITKSYQGQLSALEEQRREELKAAEQRFEAQLSALSDEHRRSSEESVARAEAQLREQFAGDNLRLFESMKKQEAEATAVLDQLKTVQEEFSDYKLKTRSIAAEKLELLKANDELQSQVQTCSAKIKQLNTQLESTNTENQAIKSELEQRKAALEKSETSSAQYRDEASLLREKVEQWKGTATAAQKELEIIKSSAEQSRKAYEELKTACAEKEQALQNDVEQMKVEREKLNDEKALLKEKVGSLEQEVSELKKSIEIEKSVNLKLSEGNELLSKENKRVISGQNSATFNQFPERVFQYSFSMTHNLFFLYLFNQKNSFLFSLLFFSSYYLI